MPLYEYLCAACGTRTEKLMRVSELKAAIRCPKCGKQAKKAISAFSVAGISKGGDDSWESMGDGEGDLGGDDDWGGGGFDDFDD